MHRRPLLTQLHAYRQRWPAEAATADRLISFVDAHPDCFERSLQVGHVTGSAWLVDKAGSRVLLTHHRKLDLWLQLGGHVDGMTDVLEAAVREAREESGLDDIVPVGGEIFDLDIHLIPARPGEPAHHHHDIRFALQAHGSEAYVVSDESHDLAWVEIECLDRFTSEESMLRMARKWRDRGGA